MPFFPLPKGNISILLRKKRFLVLGMHGSAFLCWMNGNKMAATIQCITVQTLISLPEISGHGPIFSVYSSVYAIVEVNGRRWELGIKHRR